MRELRLRSSSEALAELDRLEAAPPAGIDPARREQPVDGPWSLGEVLAHCGQSIEYSMDGYPEQRSALFCTTIGRLAKGIFLRRGHLSHDVAASIPGAPALGTVSAADGMARVRAAFARFVAFEGDLAPHFAYGRVSKADYDALHAMHLADHLSRIVPGT